MTFLGAFLLGGVFIWSAMTALWILSLLIKDSSIVDIFWGLGFVLAALFYFTITEGYGARRALITLLVLVWGVRLGVHLGIRNIGKGEDFRYQKWRKKYGVNYWWVSYFQVFMLQGVVMWLISAPILAAQINDGPAYLTVFDILGVFVWLVGFFFEAVGDWQLSRFRADPANKGKVLNTGLWRYTRHPNYFGDATQWWGLYLIAVATPWGLLTIFSPALMTYLLINVSGVAMLERSMRKKPKYDEYIRRTSAFFPLPPRRRAK